MCGSFCGGSSTVLIKQDPCIGHLLVAKVIECERMLGLIINVYISCPTVTLTTQEFKNLSLPAGLATNLPKNLSLSPRPVRS